MKVDFVHKNKVQNQMYNLIINRNTKKHQQLFLLLRNLANKELEARRKQNVNSHE